MFGFVSLLKSFLNWLMKVTAVQMMSYLVDVESLNIRHGIIVMICVLGLNPSLKICKHHQTSTLPAIDAPYTTILRVYEHVEHTLNMLDPVAD